MDQLHPYHAGGGAVERLPQWTPVETRELLSIRAELHPCFAETKRNKPLWEAISSRMLLKGFCRTPEQCKSKWKNLLTRFKGTETMEIGEGYKQYFPYYEEMRRIFSGRLEKEEGEEEEDEEEEEEEEVVTKNKMRRRKKKKKKRVEERGRLAEKVERVLGELTRRQEEREARWLKAAEAREADRSCALQEWRQAMAAILEERMNMERRWREREEERRAMEEVRAERRDLLVSAIVARLDEGDEVD